MRWWTGTSWGPYAGPGPAPGAPYAVTADTTTSVISHVGFFVLAVILPLIIRQTEGKKNEYARHHSTEALNFQLTFLVVWLSGSVVGIAALIGTATPSGSVTAWVALPFVLMFAVFVAGAAMSIVGAVHASRGDWWRYPVSIRFVPGARGQIGSSRRRAGRQSPPT
jgi:hypothetical protein